MDEPVAPGFVSDSLTSPAPIAPSRRSRSRSLRRCRGDPTAPPSRSHARSPPPSTGPVRLLRPDERPGGPRPRARWWGGPGPRDRPTAPSDRRRLGRRPPSRPDAGSPRPRRTGCRPVSRRSAWARPTPSSGMSCPAAASSRSMISMSSRPRRSRRSTRRIPTQIGQGAGQGMGPRQVALPEGPHHHAPPWGWPRPRGGAGVAGWRHPPSAGRRGPRRAVFVLRPGRGDGLRLRGSGTDRCRRQTRARWVHGQPTGQAGHQAGQRQSVGLDELSQQRFVGLVDQLRQGRDPRLIGETEVFFTVAVEDVRSPRRGQSRAAWATRWSCRCRVRRRSGPPGVGSRRRSSFGCRTAG